jgi:ABC-2 type transport system permease protein
MSSIWTIGKRELKSLFVSPIGYVFLGLFALISGIQFLLSLERFDGLLQQAKIQAQLMKNPEALSYINLNGMLISGVVAFAFFLLIFIIPAITMRAICEEKNQGTYELLMTSPITAWQIVLGKFLACFLFFALVIATHGLFLTVMFGYGNPEPGPVLAGYLGLLLGGGAFVTIGIFTSAITRHYIIAYILALVICLGLMMVGWAAGTVSGNLSEFLQQASVTSHFENFNKGIISVSSIVYFVTLWIFFLSSARIAVQSMARN